MMPGKGQDASAPDPVSFTNRIRTTLGPTNVTCFGFSLASRDHSRENRLEIDSPNAGTDLVHNYVRKPGPLILAAYVLVAMALAAGINSLIVFSEAAEWTESLTKPSFALTGLQIGLVWEVLFASMATAFWFIRRTPPLPDRRAASTAMAAVFLVILSFPFYAILPQDLLNSFVGTLGSAFLAWVATLVVFRNSRKAGAMMLPLALWLSFASVIAFHVYRLNPPPTLL